MNETSLLPRLKDFIANAHAAVRLRINLQPVGGPGDKFFPPTYEGGTYAEEERLLDGREEKSVLVNSVAAEAARLEAALKQGLEEGEVSFPVVALDVEGFGRLYELDLPHRLFDAYLVHAEINGTKFWDTEAGREIHSYQRPAATGIYRHSPVTLLFGGWDTHGVVGGNRQDKRGSLLFRYPRALVSEIAATGAQAAKGVRSKGDPFNLTGTLYEAESGGWTPNQAEAKKSGGKEIPFKMLKAKGEDWKEVDADKPSVLGLGQVTPSFDKDNEGTRIPGGYTAREIRQIAVLSLPALRRLTFPAKPGEAPNTEANQARNNAARVVLAALGLYALAKAHAEGFWLRSRCHLVAHGAPEVEFIRADGSVEKAALPSPAQAAADFKAAVDAAEKIGLIWRKEPLLVKPTKPLGDLIRQQGIQ